MTTDYSEPVDFLARAQEVFRRRALECPELDCSALASPELDCSALQEGATVVGPAKLHDDFSLADWRRAFANYDRKPWQTD